ncbi:hypothetical protein KGQ74_02585 [Patescibacteria group bacterium]|nr:hypothetical protein [Patescibacteria group bacterium]
MPEKNIPQTQSQAPVMTTKHHFITAAMAAGIILVLALLVWIPFKVLPALFSSGSNFVATTLSSTLVPATSTAQNSNTAQTSNTNSGSRTYASAPASSYAGLPDLAVSLIATGIIDPSSGQFIATPYAGANDLPAVKFAVRNIGTNVSGPWTMRLTMPSRTTPIYDAPYQQSIRPGDEMVFTASFDSPVAQGVNTGYIAIDPLGLVAESNKLNNSLTVNFVISGVNYTTAYSTANTVYPGTTYTYTPTTPGYGTLYTWTNINANCYATPQSSYPGTPVTWIVTASGGNGYFSYRWSGTDGLYSTSNAVTETYSLPGAKIADVAVTSNGQTITVQCSAMVY